MQEKWKSNPTIQIKSSLTLRTQQRNHHHDDIDKPPQEKAKNNEDADDIKSPFQVKEVFTHPIVKSIGRRSSTIARVLPTGVPTLCDSPMRLRVL
jgi:hypothetical protein